jgi:hypothetical protein
LTDTPPTSSPPSWLAPAAERRSIGCDACTRLARAPITSRSRR